MPHGNICNIEREGWNAPFHDNVAWTSIITLLGGKRLCNQIHNNPYILKTLCFFGSQNSENGQSKSKDESEDVSMETEEPEDKENKQPTKETDEKEAEEDDKKAVKDDKKAVKDDKKAWKDDEKAEKDDKKVEKDDKKVEKGDKKAGKKDDKKVDLVSFNFSSFRVKIKDENGHPQLAQNSVGPV